MAITETIFAPISVQLGKQPQTNNIGFGRDNSWVVEDHHQLEDLIKRVRSSVKVDKLRSWLDLTIGLATSFLATHAGTAPSFFPIFSHQGFVNSNLPDKILLKQNSLTAEQVSSFFSLFLHLPQSNRPTVRFEYHDRSSSLNLLAKVANLIRPFEFFGDQKRDIILNKKPPGSKEFISFVLDGNYGPNLYTNFSVDHDFLHAWAIARNSKLYDTPLSAQSKIEEVIGKMHKLYSQAPVSEHPFWLSLLVQMQLDLAYVKDKAPNETMMALALARKLRTNEIIAHCERFANQTLGVSSEALAMLEDSCRRFDQMPANSEASLQFSSSRFGAKQNRNTTALIALKTRPSAEQFLADYEEAKSTLPSYVNMAMLGNAAAMAYLCTDRAKESIPIFEDALLQNALPVDRLNLKINFLAAQFVESSSLDEGIFESTCDEIAKLELGENWEYQRARMTVNLLEIAPNKHLREKIWGIGKSSSFWHGLPHKINSEILMKSLMKKRYQHYFQNGSIPGVFGMFSEKYQLSLCIDKDWK